MHRDRPFHLLRMPKLEVFLTDNRGWGVRAVDMMQRGDFICEYVGMAPTLHLQPSYAISRAGCFVTVTS